jgi:isocitrate/isopropylmalate dehydrogenase
MMTQRIAVMPGDGIGREVVPEGLRVLEAVARRFDLSFKFDEFDWSCDYYLKHGQMMPSDWKAQIGSTTPSSSAPLAGRTRSPIIFPCGARCSSSAASSISM